MRRLSFIVTLTGIFILLILINFSSPKTITGPQQLEKLTDYTKVQTSGRVISERILYDETKLIKIDNNIEIICNSCPVYLNKSISVIGTSEKYENKTQIVALKIKI